MTTLFYLQCEFQLKVNRSRRYLLAQLSPVANVEAYFYYNCLQLRSETSPQLLDIQKTIGFSLSILMWQKIRYLKVIKK